MCPPPLLLQPTPVLRLLCLLCLLRRLEAEYSGDSDERVKWLVYTLEQASRIADASAGGRLRVVGCKLLWVGGCSNGWFTPRREQASPYCRRRRQ